MQARIFLNSKDNNDLVYAAKFGRFNIKRTYISSLFYENVHSNGLRGPGGKAVVDSLSTWHSELFYRGDRHQGPARTLQRHS